MAFIGGGTDTFWEMAAAGAYAAADQYGAEVLVRLPSEGQKDQNRYIAEMLDAGVTGIAISPVNPPEQSNLLERAAAQVHLITHDSDAPLSGRLCYIGTDNYRAGHLCGELIKQALPEGGEIVISIGSVDQDNGRHGIEFYSLDRRGVGETRLSVFCREFWVGCYWDFSVPRKKGFRIAGVQVYSSTRR